ncbi:MAG: SRPBCC family protein, partial [Bacteroidota bacterium]
MKKLLILFAFVLGTIGVVSAQTPFVKEVDRSADKVWEEIRKMDNIDVLSSFVSHVKWTGPKGVGGERVCTSTDGQGYFRERVTGFDDKTRTYT